MFLFFLFWWSLKGRSDLCWISAFLCAILVVFDPEAVKKNFPYHWAGSVLCAACFPGMLLAWKHSPAEPLTQDTAGWRNQVPGQDGYLWISIANNHPWKTEPNPLPVRISASLCNPTFHNVERTKREKGKLPQTQWARNAKRNIRPDKGTKTRTGTQGQQRLAPAWSALLRVSPSCPSS